MFQREEKEGKQERKSRTCVGRNGRERAKHVPEGQEKEGREKEKKRKEEKRKRKGREKEGREKEEKRKEEKRKRKGRKRRGWVGNGKHRKKQEIITKRRLKKVNHLFTFYKTYDIMIVPSN